MTYLQANKLCDALKAIEQETMKSNVDKNEIIALVQVAMDELDTVKKALTPITSKVEVS